MKVVADINEGEGGLIFYCTFCNMILDIDTEDRTKLTHPKNPTCMFESKKFIHPFIIDLIEITPLSERA